MKKFQLILPLLLTACFLLPSTALAAPCPAGSPIWTAAGSTACDAFYAYQDKICCVSHDLSGACIAGPGSGSLPECSSVSWSLIVSDIEAGKFLVPVPSGYSAKDFFACASSSDKTSSACTAAEERYNLYCIDWKTMKEKTDPACTPPTTAAKDAASAAVAKVAAKPTAGPLSLPNPLGNADLPALIGRIISTFLGMVGAISLVVFVYAGVRYLTAGGSEEAVKHATDTMKYAFVGLVIILFAYVITNFFFTALLKGA